MRHVDTNKVRLYYHSENTCFYASPPLIDNQMQLEQQIQLIEASDIFESAILQRPNTKWRLVKLVGFTVTVHPIRGRLLGAYFAKLPTFIKKLKCIASLLRDSSSKGKLPYNDNLCLLRAVSLAQLMSAEPAVPVSQLLCKLNGPTRETFAKWANYKQLPMEQRLRKSFPGVPLDQFNEVETLFNVNIWVYELTEEELKVRQKRRETVADNFLDDEAGEGNEEDDEEQEEEAADESFRRRKKIQTALLVRAPTIENQQNSQRLKVYVNRYENHISLITNIQQYGQCYKCQCGYSSKQCKDLEKHQQTCTGERTQKLIFPGTGMTVTKSIWEQLAQLGISTPGPQHYPYFACWDFEARICENEQAKFTPLPPSATQLPEHDCLRNELYLIRTPDLSQLDEYCYNIAAQQPCIFDIRVTVVYRLTRDPAIKQRRRCIIEPVNIIHNLQDYQQVFPARHILNAMESAQLLSPNIVIDAIEFKVERKQLLFPSTLVPVSFAVNSNVPEYNSPDYDVCEEDDEDAIRRLLVSFIDRLNAISDEAYQTLRRQHDPAFDKLR